MKAKQFRPLNVFFQTLACFSLSVFAGEPALHMRTASEANRPSADTTPNRRTDYSLTRRADVPQAGEGQFTFGMRSPDPNEANSSSLATQFNAQIGLGRGFRADVYMESDQNTRNLKPGAGLQWQFFGDREEPLAMALHTDFRKSSFVETESEGHVNVGWIGTYKKEANEVSLNTSAGADLDGDTTYFELRAVAGRRILDTFLVGIEGENRAASRSDGTSDRLSFTGGTVQLGLGRISLSGSAGISWIARGNETGISGPQGNLRIGYSF